MTTKLQKVPGRIWLKNSKKSTICRDIELKFGTEAKFGPLSTKANINLQFDVMMRFFCFSLLC